MGVGGVVSVGLGVGVGHAPFTISKVFHSALHGPVPRPVGAPSSEEAYVVPELGVPDIIHLPFKLHLM